MATARAAVVMIAANANTGRRQSNCSAPLRRRNCSLVARARRPPTAAAVQLGEAGAKLLHNASGRRVEPAASSAPPPPQPQPQPPLSASGKVECPGDRRLARCVGRESARAASSAKLIFIQFSNSFRRARVCLARRGSSGGSAPTRKSETLHHCIHRQHIASSQKTQVTAATTLCRLHNHFRACSSNRRSSYSLFESPPAACVDVAAMVAKRWQG